MATAAAVSVPTRGSGTGLWLKDRRWDLTFISLSITLVASPYLLYLVLMQLPRLVTPLAAAGISVDELERRATEELEAIEATGGAVEAIERGYMQRAIQEEAYAHQQEVEAGTRVVVGVNRFQDEGKPQPLQLYRTDPEAENAQVRGLEALRRERDSRSVSAALARLRDAALGEENLLPPILQAVKAYATVGEICGVLREVFGEYKAPTGL